MTKSNPLDQFFTKQYVADFCVDKMKELPLPWEKILLVEPTAGSGNFVKSAKKILPYSTIEYFDIDPQYEGTAEADFLKEELVLSSLRENTVVFGNPPFGKRAKLALDFLNKSFEYSDVVAFILPLTFRRYLTQKLVYPDAHLVLDVDLPENLFEMNGKDHMVRCCFQVWTTSALLDTLEDLRKTQRPPLNHPDYQAWIYNATDSAKRVFSEDWEFAVLRQGWGDFTPIMRDNIIDLSLKRQWLLIKPHSDEARRNLLSIDYDALAEGNTSVKGFGKADLVEEYTRLFG